MLVVVLAGIAQAGQQKAPELSLKDINGRTVTLSDFTGKVVLLTGAAF